MSDKYLNYEGLKRLVENIDKKYAPISAIVFKSTVENIDSLPAISTQKAGWMYNVKTGGLTTDDFVEGAGHIVADGENIAAVELYTGVYTQVASPAATDDPKALGWYEVDTVTTYFAPGEPVSDPATEGFYEFTVGTPTADPKAEGFYEASGVNFILTTDETIQVGKDYYTGAVSGDSTVVTGKTYYESKTETTYKLSQDRLPVSGKDYFEAETVMRWDLLGGVFDLEDRYLEFGDKFPQGPASRMTDGRTFLFMGDTIKGYTYVTTPEGRPSENGYFEGAFTPVSDASTIYNPKQQALYEADGTTAGVYVLSDDTTYDSEKTYYTGAFTASTDSSVDPAKKYYTEEALYKKAVIYTYDKTNDDWVAQSGGGSDELIPITTKEVDDLFI